MSPLTSVSWFWPLFVLCSPTPVSVFVLMPTTDYVPYSLSPLSYVVEFFVECGSSFAIVSSFRIRRTGLVCLSYFVFFSLSFAVQYSTGVSLTTLLSWLFLAFPFSSLSRPFFALPFSSLYFVHVHLCSFGSPIGKQLGSAPALLRRVCTDRAWAVVATSGWTIDQPLTPPIAPRRLTRCCPAPPKTVGPCFLSSRSGQTLLRWRILCTC